jgi:hypothetical protein
MSTAENLEHLKKAEAYLKEIRFPWAYLLHGPVLELEAHLRGEQSSWPTLGSIPVDIARAHAKGITYTRDGNGDWMTHEPTDDPFFGPFYPVADATR